MILHLFSSLHRLDIIIFIFSRKKIFGPNHYFPDESDMKNIVIIRVWDELLK